MYPTGYNNGEGLFVSEDIQRRGQACIVGACHGRMRDRGVSTTPGPLQQQDIDAALERGLTDVRAGHVVPVAEAFIRVRRALGLPG